MSEAVQVALIVSSAPFLASMGALWQATRGRREAAAANRAVNHIQPGQPTLYQHVAANADQVAKVSLRIGALDTKVDAYMTEDKAAHDLMLDRLAGIDSGLADAKELAEGVRHDLSQFNEVDRLGAEGRIERRRDQVTDTNARLQAIHDEIRTMNDLTVGESVDAIEDRRIEAIPVTDRTPAEQQHLTETETP